MNKATARADRARELHDQLEQSVTELVTGEDWRAMLDTAAKFHRYSPNNVLLIMRQMPEASMVAGFNAWKALGRHVRKGEHAIRVLAPCKYRVEDDATGESHMVLRGFTTACVFDVSQTDGEPLPARVRAELLAGDAPASMWDNLAAQVLANGYRLERGDCQDANGRTNYATRCVTVRDDVDDAQACKTLAHELAHVMLHEPDGLACSLCAMDDRRIHEVEAESVAYIVCHALGLVSDQYSLPYVATWAGGDVAKVQETAVKVVEAAASILTALTATQPALEAV
jgi:antirestriction protein ArdC